MPRSRGMPRVRRIWRAELHTGCSAPGVVLGELCAAAAAGALKRVQAVRAATALAEALHGAGALKGGRLDVQVADAALLVVCAQGAQLPCAALHLRPECQLWQG